MNFERGKETKEAIGVGLAPHVCNVVDKCVAQYRLNLCNHDLRIMAINDLYKRIPSAKFIDIIIENLDNNFGQHFWHATFNIDLGKRNFIISKTLS